MLGYIKLGDIEGMATQEGHEKWIPIEGLFHGANRNVAEGSNDPVSDLKNSRVQIGGIQVVKGVDASSPRLLECGLQRDRLSRGENPPDSQLGGKRRTDVLRVHLNQCLYQNV